MRVYQNDIYNAVAAKGNWNDRNTIVSTMNNVTEVFYYNSKIAVVDHSKKCATFDYCGYHTASTTSRINAVKKFCEDKGYHYSVK